MTKVSTAEKRTVNRGVKEYVQELVYTDPRHCVTAKDLLPGVQAEYPHASYATVINCLGALKKKGLVTKHEPVKGTMSARWSSAHVPKWLVQAKRLDQSKRVKPHLQDALTPEDVGRALITAIVNMKKRIEEQLDRIQYLEKTLKNLEGSAKLVETTLRNKLRERDKIIESLKAQLEPDPAIMFKLADIANFTGEERGKNAGKT